MKNKPFGLSIAVTTALEAIKSHGATPSVAITNLFFLQKSETFPKPLESSFFLVSRYNTNEVEKKLLVKLLDDLKKPSVSKQEVLENAFSEGWVHKKTPKQEVFAPRKKTQRKSKTTPKTTAAPTVVVKKARI